MKRILLTLSISALLAGCSGHATTMQDVRAYCRSVTTNMDCEAQDSICARYSEVTLRDYSSAKECRQSCEKVRQESAMHQGLQSCLDLYQTVEGKCNEFCNDNYK